jgi:formamidopyrimidine-DNA glycosylase
MPELPEVETVVRTLRPLLIGATIQDVNVFHPRMLLPNAKKVTSVLKGLTFKKIERIGKFIIFIFSGDQVLVSHLRMEGKFFVHSTTEGMTRFARFIIHLSDGRKLIYDDMRKFGTMTLSTLATYRHLKALKSLGQEPDTVNDPLTIHQQWQDSKRPIKSLLLDQTILLGLGNIYADEVLFDTNIHPLTMGKDLTIVDTQRLIRSSQKILKAAIKAGGTRIRSYTSGAAIDGQFSLQIHVYDRSDQACHRCHHRLDKITIAGRGSHYCPKCQHHPKFPKVIGVTGQIATGKSTLVSVGQSLGYITLSADQIVSDIYQSQSGQKTLKAWFPEVFEKKKLNRFRLLEILVRQPKRYQQLIKWLFPLVKDQIHMALIKMPKSAQVLLEVPLLFQGKVDAYCDIIIGIEMPAGLQRKLLQERVGKTADLLWVLNERNRYQDFIHFLDHRIRNDQSKETFINRSKNLLTQLSKSL